MSTPARIAKLSGVCETLGQLIKHPKSLGLREQLPPRVLDALTNMREILREEMSGRSSVSSGENDLAAELSQDADTQSTAGCDGFVANPRRHLSRQNENSRR
jgi:hypothetical protein